MLRPHTFPTFVFSLLGEPKLFYQSLEVHLDENFQRLVNSYAEIRKEESHLGTEARDEIFGV